MHVYRPVAITIIPSLKEDHMRLTTQPRKGWPRHRALRPQYTSCCLTKRKFISKVAFLHLCQLSPGKVGHATGLCVPRRQVVV